MARFPSHYPDIGVLGEELVAQWLQARGWVILHHRWRCRQGEIDLIARLNPAHQNCQPLLVFVEVKTRSPNNWDAGGLLALDKQKQIKLWRTAGRFLATHPHLADYTCRFDLALVRYEHLETKYQLHLEEYISSAFE